MTDNMMQLSKALNLNKRCLEFMTERARGPPANHAKLQAIKKFQEVMENQEIQAQKYLTNLL